MKFKLFRKLYFKIYHLLKLIGIFILVLIPNIVKADECNNLLENVTWTAPNPNDSGWISYSSGQITGIERDKKYTFYAIDENNQLSSKINPYTNITGITSRPWYVIIDNYFVGNTNKITITSTYSGNKRNIYYSWNSYGSAKNTEIIEQFENLTFYLVEGEEVCIPTPPEPPTPPTPPSNQVLNNFITIYTSKITYLATGVVENPYMMCWVGIIFSFVVLELFLHILHIRGGYKK